MNAECEAARNTLAADTNEFNKVKDEKAAVSAQLDLANQFETLKGDADDLGRKYNELNNKALKARDAAKAKDAEWAAARDARDEAQADLDAAKNLPSVEDAETALKNAKKAADDAAAKFNELDNDALNAEKAAKDAEKQKSEDLKAANDAQVALEAAKKAAKKLPSVEDAEAALKAATEADDKAAAKFNELDNKALEAENTLDAKKAAWNKALAAANAAQVAFAAAQQAQATAAQAVKDAEDAAGAKSEEAKAAAAKFADAQSNCLNAYANHQLAMQAQANALAELNAAKKVLGSLVLVEPTQPQATITPAKAPAKDEKKADEKKVDKAALPTTGDNVAAQVTIIAGLGAAAIAAGATRRRFNA